MPSLSTRLHGGIGVLLALLLIAAVALNCANIIVRYFFNFSLLSGDELQVFAMIVITFIGSITISAERQHLRMDVFLQSTSARTKRFIAILEATVTAAMGCVMSWASFEFVRRLYLMDQRSGMADLPMWLPHSAIMFCFAFIALIALHCLYRALFKTEQEK
ncbi:TRAP transporter small permease [Pusillimonas sp.]|uniref:TRAP transporter small permease n=1 Tax=Pusillimonas sp. TaxID=3040095 RepID=UPI0029BAD3D8|nr:TRAP transporter small permease [Pusillimonas sp.]MDX3895064.1 TRAP transporter small permease [Pusillimonas sp.]